MVSFVVKLSWMNLLSTRCLAASARMDSFLAFVSKFFKAEAVAVVGLNIEMYASISLCVGGSRYWPVFSTCDHNNIACATYK